MIYISLYFCLSISSPKLDQQSSNKNEQQRAPTLPIYWYCLSTTRHKYKL